jgi:glutathione S-transferase
MFIAEKGVDIPTVEVDLREQEQLGEAFLKINPHATVPVLELDDKTRLLSTAGCRAYLEAAYPKPTLLGVDAKEKGVIADLIWRIEYDAITAVGECLRNASKSMKGRALTGLNDYAQIPELAERGRQRATSFMPTLNALIGDKAFIASDVITAADIDAFIFVEFAKWVKVQVPDECTNIVRWYNSMSERPSAKR